MLRFLKQFISTPTLQRACLQHVLCPLPCSSRPSSAVVPDSQQPSNRWELLCCQMLPQECPHPEPWISNFLLLQPPAHVLCLPCWTKERPWRQTAQVHVCFATRIRRPGFKFFITWTRDCLDLLPVLEYAETEAPIRSPEAEDQDKWDEKVVVTLKTALDENQVHWGRSWFYNTTAMGPGKKGASAPLCAVCTVTGDSAGLSGLNSLPQLWHSGIPYMPFKGIFIILSPLACSMI